MKNRINILLQRILCLSALMLLVVGCSDDLRYSSGSLSSYEFREVKVPVSFDVESMISADPPTRSPEDGNVDAELRIHDFWLLQFDPDGIRVTKPYYHRATDGDHVPMVVPVKEGVKFRCVVLANTNDPDLFNLENTQKFDQIKDLPVQEIKGGPFYRADRAYCVVEGGMQYPLMSGETEVDYMDNKLGSVLRCYFAQVMLHFRFDKDKFKDEDFDRIKGIRVVNVPKKYRYTGELYHPFEKDRVLYKEDPEHPDSVIESENRKDYTTFEILVTEDHQYQVLWEKVKKDRGFDYVVYVPRRFMLPFQAISTLIAETGIQFQFTLKDEPEEIGYQTVNIVKSHDHTSARAKREICPRTKYDLTILVKELISGDSGDATYTDQGNVDSFEPFENPTILAHANSFMINPDKMHDQDFKIPLSRIDQFYFVSSVSSAYTYYEQDLDRTGKLSEKYGSYYEYPMAIDSSTEWTAEILWQDTPERLIYFVDPDYDGQVDYNAINAGGHSSCGTTFAPDWDTGLNDGGFCFRPTGAKGNLVIGIRKTYEEDYDEQGFHHGYFPYYDGTLPDDNNKQYLWCFHLWFTDYEPEGDVMDRNLGAMSADDPGLYYYSNRKDPVPYATALYGKPVYDHLGNPSACIKIGGTPPVAGPDVKDPDTDYQMMVGGPDWPNGWGGEKPSAFFVPYGFLRMAEMEWAYYYLRHPLIFQKSTEGYWFSPETKYKTIINDDIMVWANLHPYYNAGNSIYHWLDRLLNEDDPDTNNQRTSHSKMLTQMELPMAEEPINRKSMFDPCPPGWRLPEYISDIQGNTRNMKGKYWTSTYNIPNQKTIQNDYGTKDKYDISELKTNGIKGKVLNVNGGSVTESYEKLATFLPVRCVRHDPLIENSVTK